MAVSKAAEPKNGRAGGSGYSPLQPASSARPLVFSALYSQG